MLHDENYKRLCASSLMVQDVLRACLPAMALLYIQRCDSA